MEVIIDTINTEMDDSNFPQTQMCVLLKIASVNNYNEHHNLFITLLL